MNTSANENQSCRYRRFSFRPIVTMFPLPLASRYQKSKAGVKLTGCLWIYYWEAISIMGRIRVLSARESVVDSQPVLSVDFLGNSRRECKDNGGAQNVRNQ